MGAIISWILGNPLIILAMIGVFTFTSVFSDARAWWSERHAVQTAVKPWIEAVARRDRIAKAQDEILVEAAQAKQKAEDEVNELKDQFEHEDIRRKAAGAADCNWSDDDVRLLNAAKAVRTRAPAR